MNTTNPLPEHIEQAVKDFAHRKHIGNEEALLRLIENGIQSSRPEPRIKGLAEEPMTDEQAAIVDDAVAIAMESRRRRSRQIFDA